MTTGLYIGRFQPLHLGHLSAIEQAFKRVEHLLIGIGSAQYHHLANNPFTAEERLKMLEIGLKERGLDKNCGLYLIPDIHNNQKWVEHVKSLVPHFDSVFVGEENLSKALFELADIPVIKVEKIEPISATEVRKKIESGENLSDILSPGINEYLIMIQAQKRLRQLAS